MFSFLFLLLLPLSLALGKTYNRHVRTFSNTLINIDNASNTGNYFFIVQEMFSHFDLPSIQYQCPHSDNTRGASAVPAKIAAVKDKGSGISTQKLGHSI